MINKRYVYKAIECENCGGWGSYTETIMSIEDKFLRRPKKWICPKCNGTGEKEQGEESGEMSSEVS